MASSSDNMREQVLGKIVREDPSKWCKDQESDNSTVNIPELTNAYRYLRNDFGLHAEEMRQKILQDNRNIIPITVNILCKSITFYQTHDVLSNDQLVLKPEDLLALSTCVLQFLGNFVSGSIDAQCTVWNLIPADIFNDLLRFNDLKIVTYSSMLLYNCINITTIRSITESVTTLNNDSSEEHHQFTYLPVLKALIALISSHNSVDWALFSLQKLLSSNESLLPIFCPLLNVEEQILLLNVLDNALDSLKTGDENAVITLSGIKYLLQVFTNCATTILEPNLQVPEVTSSGMDKSQPINMVNPQLVLEILKVLCKLSGKYEHPMFGVLQTSEELLEKTIELLKHTQALARSEDPTFVSIRNLSYTNDPTFGDHPFFGFKRDLVRILANLVYQNRKNQDLVRNLGGIPVILDCTVVDMNNPFMTQWVIFAIRNLCDGNLENQGIIAGLNPKGLLADNPQLLDQFRKMQSEHNSVVPD